MSRLKNPLALRLPLWDPDRFLEATAWLVRPIFTVYGLLAWIALVITGLVVVALNWGALQARRIRRRHLAAVCGEPAHRRNCRREGRRHPGKAGEHRPVQVP